MAYVVDHTENTFDAGTEGWSAESSTASVAHDTSTFRSGGGSLAITQTFAATGYSNVRVRQRDSVRDASAGGDQFALWLLVPGGAAGSFVGSVYAYDDAYSNYQCPERTPVTPGVWTQVIGTVDPAWLASLRSIGLQLDVSDAGADNVKTVHLDDVTQGSQQSGSVVSGSGAAAGTASASTGAERHREATGLVEGSGSTEMRGGRERSTQGLCEGSGEAASGVARIRAGAGSTSGAAQAESGVSRVRSGAGGASGAAQAVSGVTRERHAEAEVLAVTFVISGVTRERHAEADLFGTSRAEANGSGGAFFETTVRGLSAVVGYGEIVHPETAGAGLAEGACTAVAKGAAVYRGGGRSAGFADTRAVWVRVRTGTTLYEVVE